MFIEVPSFLANHISMESRMNFLFLALCYTLRINHTFTFHLRCISHCCHFSQKQTKKMSNWLMNTLTNAHISRAQQSKMTLLSACFWQDKTFRICISVKLCAMEPQGNSQRATNLQVKSMNTWNLHTFMKLAWAGAGAVSTESIGIPLFLLTQELTELCWAFWWWVQKMWL